MKLLRSPVTRTRLEMLRRTARETLRYRAMLRGNAFVMCVATRSIP